MILTIREKMQTESVSCVPEEPSAKIEIVPKRFVGENFPCFIIAEVGQNHQGNIEIAKRLIQIARNCGVDCVKFQKSSIQSRFTKEVLNSPYASIHSWGDTYGEHRAKLELTEENFVTLKKYCDDIGIYFTASGMDQISIDFLYSLNVPFFKVGSADSTNLPLLRHVAKYQKPVVISTGMTDLENLCKMYTEISRINKSIALLQCTSCYPTHPRNVNLNVIKYFRKCFPDAVIGYSGHEKGMEVSLAAVACGAKILERHITLDHSMKGSDHCASLNPVELAHLVQKVRQIEEAFGSYNKMFLDCEIPCFEKLGKTLVAAKNIPSGTVLIEDMIHVKVASKKGIDPIDYDNVIGKKLRRDLQEEETIEVSDICECN